MVDFTEITESDPRKILLEIEKAIRPNADVMRNPAANLDTRMAILSYFSKLKHAAKLLGLNRFDFEVPEEIKEIVEFVDDISTELDKMKIDLLIEDINRKHTVELDTPWRDKIHTYVAVIRTIVENATDLKIAIREDILRKLQTFDAEVNRTRTEVEVFTDVFDSICEGLSEGAVALRPAVRLGERIIGALARLQGQPPVLSLPRPENFDLPPPELLEASPDHHGAADQVSAPQTSRGSGQQVG